MAGTTIAITAGHPFNILDNKIRSSAAGAWTAIADDTTPDRPVAVHGVYWSSITSGSTLQIRDRDEDEWYYYTPPNTGILRNPTIDYLTLPIPVFTKFEYLDSVGSNTIIIYGVFL